MVIRRWSSLSTAQPSAPPSRVCAGSSSRPPRILSGHPRPARRALADRRHGRGSPADRLGARLPPLAGLRSRSPPAGEERSRLHRVRQPPRRRGDDRPGAGHMARGVAYACLPRRLERVSSRVFLGTLLPGAHRPARRCERSALADRDVASAALDRLARRCDGARARGSVLAGGQGGAARSARAAVGSAWCRCCVLRPDRQRLVRDGSRAPLRGR